RRRDPGFPVAAQARRGGRRDLRVAPRGPRTPLPRTASTADDVGRAVFDRSDEYEALRTSVRRLAEDHIAPNAAAADEREEFPAASWSAWRGAGVPRLSVPGADGGPARGRE